MLVAAVVARLELHARKLRLSVVEQKIVDLLRRDLGGACVDAEIDARRFIAPAAEKSDRLDVHAAGVRADNALLDLRAFDALKREELAPDVFENLDRVAVERVDLVSQLQKRHHGVGVDLGAAILQRVDGGGIGQLGDDQAGAVRRHEIAVDPRDIKNNAEVGVGDLRQRRAVPVEKIIVARDRQAVEGVVERHEVRAAHVAEHRHGAIRCDQAELRAHNAVTAALPVDRATVDARPGAVLHNAIRRAQKALGDARVHRHRNHVDRIRRAYGR